MEETRCENKNVQEHLCFNMELGAMLDLIFGGLVPFVAPFTSFLGRKRIAPRPRGPSQFRACHWLVRFMLTLRKVLQLFSRASMLCWRVVFSLVHSFPTFQLRQTQSKHSLLTCLSLIGPGFPSSRVRIFHVNRVALFSILRQAC